MRRAWFTFSLAIVLGASPAMADDLVKFQEESAGRIQ